METRIKKLKEIVDSLLAEKSDEAYEQLYLILRQPEHEAILRKSEPLGILREMVERWKVESQRGTSCIFHEITNLEQAECVYLSIKHGLWRIEQELSLEKCIPFVQKMSQKHQSRYLIAWIAYANLKEPERVLACLGNYMMQYNVVSALEVLSYGLLLFPNSSDILLQKAQSLMDLDMWQEALKTLKQIDKPSEEINQIIVELEEAINS